MFLEPLTQRTYIWTAINEISLQKRRIIHGVRSSVFPLVQASIFEPVRSSSHASSRLIHIMCTAAKLKTLFSLAAVFQLRYI